MTPLISVLRDHISPEDMQGIRSAHDLISQDVNSSPVIRVKGLNSLAEAKLSYESGDLTLSIELYNLKLGDSVLIMNTCKIKGDNLKTLLGPLPSESHPKRTGCHGQTIFKSEELGTCNMFAMPSIDPGRIMLYIEHNKEISSQPPSYADSDNLSKIIGFVETCLDLSSLFDLCGEFNSYVIKVEAKEGFPSMEMVPTSLGTPYGFTTYDLCIDIPGITMVIPIANKGSLTALLKFLNRALDSLIS